MSQTKVVYSAMQLYEINYEWREHKYSDAFDFGLCILVTSV